MISSRSFFVGGESVLYPWRTSIIVIPSLSSVRTISEADQVVGFVTAISDGVLSAYIPFLEVLPSHRGRGIGQELVRRVLSQLQDIYSISLHCDPDLESFYERLGMQALGGMAIRNYVSQSGRHLV